MHIFIDTNLFQQAVRSQSPDATVLKALLVFLKKEDSKKPKNILLVTDQVKDEYYRAEDKNVSLTREKVKDSKCETSDVWSLLLKKPPEKLSEAQKDLIKRSEKIETSFEKDKQKQLESFDKNIVIVKETVAELFSISKQINCDEEAFRHAEMRSKRGMHPKGNRIGKENDLDEVTIGDAINWELLLREKPAKLIFITKDGDFVNENGILHKTLQDEWNRKLPDSEIRVFRSIYEFLDFEKAIKKPRKSGKKKSKKIDSPIITGGSEVSSVSADEQPVAPSVAEGGGLSSFVSTLNGGGSGNFYINKKPLAFSIFHSDAELKPNHCPYCGTGNDKLMELVTFIGKKYYCSNCSRTFSVE